MKNIGFFPADILIPNKNIDLQKWSVIACDQHTSEPEFWRETEKIVGTAPSSLRMIFPEIYLEDEDAEKRIQAIIKTMEDYTGLFDTIHDSYILSVRTFPGGRTRTGLVGKLDLECYDYSAGAKTLVRSTEGTVLSRIPPRVAIRENAPLELPHIMILIDDPDNTVIAPVISDKSTSLLWETKLIQNGGKLAGYKAGNPERIMSALMSLLVKQPEPALLFAVGDGNHSLATALECYRRLKAQIGDDAAKTHPARYALCELVNIHDKSIEFEPIHRVLFNIDPEDVLLSLKSELSMNEGKDMSHNTLTCISDKLEISLYSEISDASLLVSRLENFLNSYIARRGGKIDYIHGENNTRRLAVKPDNIGFILPNVKKDNFFAEITKNGPYPRKTFSIGEAEEKRYYFECRKIKI